MALAACVDQPARPADAGTLLPVPLPTPAVTMAADPPPPFTYWAPEGATIRTHPREPTIWIAETPDGDRKFYFGDQCLASERQGWIGQPVDALPEPAEGSVWRIGCSTCEQTSDLRRDRLNISFDETSRLIVDVSCG
ncbi:hypothetical protein [Brevundimonas sp. PAMC22021]|uniref:hypothetical protein n=1 Tax=Brevundimonas sp. PAMC22021 TaxID=2861285 RepID=UPI001C62C028|nr:hypothetical protein [Brevundimonas sp. PAMC22021]QYF87025.1 hypothetical protein KY493_00395 [Brevundimonas sp. PAMC22021]